MLKVKMLKSKDGAVEGDFVAFQDAEARALVKAGEAEPAPWNAVNPPRPPKTVEEAAAEKSEPDPWAKFKE